MVGRPQERRRRSPGPPFDGVHGPGAVGSSPGAASAAATPASSASHDAYAGRIRSVLRRRHRVEVGEAERSGPPRSQLDQRRDGRREHGVAVGVDLGELRLARGPHRDGRRRGEEPVVRERPVHQRPDVVGRLAGEVDRGQRGRQRRVLLDRRTAGPAARESRRSPPGAAPRSSAAAPRPCRARSCRGRRSARSAGGTSRPSPGRRAAAVLRDRLLPRRQREQRGEPAEVVDVREVAARSDRSASASRGPGARGRAGRTGCRARGRRTRTSATASRRPPRG